MSERAAEAKPWPRIKATLLSARHFARSRPCSMLVTSRLVSPNLSAMSHTGTLAPMKLPEGITGRSAVAYALPNGRWRREHESENVSGVGVDDRMDVGPRFVDGGVNESLEIERALFVTHRLSVEAQFDDVVALDQLGCERAGKKKVLRIVGIADAD